MTYSGAATAKGARETLGRALASLQEDPNIPQDVLVVAQNLAQAVGALFEAERAADESAGKASVKGALGLIGQTLALLQDVRGQHRGIQLATESLAQSMSLLYPLTAAPSMRPPATNAPMMGTPSPVAQGYAPTVQQAPFQVPQASQPTQVQSPPFQQSSPASPAYNPQQAAYNQQPQQSAPQAAFSQPQAAPQAAFSQPQAAPQAAFSQPQAAPQAAFSQPQAAPQQVAQQARPQQAQKPATAGEAEAIGYRGNEKRETIEVNIGATTESNFFVGFSGEISEGGVFAATYNISSRGTPLRLLVTLPGGFEKHVNGRVRFVRDPMDMAADETTPGMGVQFEGLDAEARELILRFVRKRPPMFYDE